MLSLDLLRHVQAINRGRIVYLVAHDYYAKAKRMNPELAKTADTKMSNMQKQFPTVDNVFAVGVNGDTYTVDDSGSCHVMVKARLLELDK